LKSSLTIAERREKARLRSKRWRRVHGTDPRRPAQRPWLAEGVFRSTWYRRRKQAREREALAARASQSQAMFDRAEAFAAIGAQSRPMRGDSRGHGAGTSRHLMRVADPKRAD